MRTHTLIALLALAGCGKNPYFSDDEGATRPSGSALSDHPDEMSLPYALGTQVKIAVKQLDASDAAVFRIKSDAPGILSVDKLSPQPSDEQIVADCTANGEGETTLRLLDGAGHERHSVLVSVRAADRAQLYAHGPFRILGRNQSALAAAEVPEARILAGGKGVFAVVYYRGGQRVYGRGIAKVGAPPTVKVESMTTSGVAVNEWLFVTPSVPGSSDMSIAAGPATLMTLPLVVVAESDLAAAFLQGELVDSPSDNQSIWELAAVGDKDSRVVHGVYFDWTLGGVPQVRNDDAKRTTGDLYRYEFDPKGAPTELVATHGKLKVATSIKAHKGWVADTTYLGCSVGRGPVGAVPPLGFALVAAALVLRGLRRRVASA